MAGVRTWKSLVLVAAVLGFVVAAAAPGSAHSGEESYVYLEFFDQTIEGRVEFPIDDLNEVLGLDIPKDEAGATAAIDESLSLIQSYALDHLKLGSGSSEWQLVFQGFDILSLTNIAYAIFTFEVEGRFDPMPRDFWVAYDGIIESKPERNALLIIATDWRSGTFNNEAEHLVVFTSEVDSHELSLGDTSLWSGFVAVVGLGVEHIQIGSDHILFIVALLLPSVLIFGSEMGWRPATGFGQSLWRVVKIATSFTVAHTITLTLGGLGVIEMSPGLVEPVIALSIALAALHNIKPLFFNREWAIAFGFGLFHGFGFAGLLADLGLDRSNRLMSLIGFNLGIEVGQIAIILLLFPALYILRRTRVYVPMMRIGSYGLTAVALAWFVDRVFGLDLGVDRVVVPLLLWPRSALFVGLLTVASIAYYRYERQRDLLWPTSKEVDAIDLGERDVEVRSRR